MMEFAVSAYLLIGMALVVQALRNPGAELEHCLRSMHPTAVLMGATMAVILWPLAFLP